MKYRRKLELVLFVLIVGVVATTVSDILLGYLILAFPWGTLRSNVDRAFLAVSGVATIAGTLAYMAPEQTGRMNRSIDSRSDLYSFGVTLYQMLTGVPALAVELQPGLWEVSARRSSGW